MARAHRQSARDVMSGCGHARVAQAPVRASHSCHPNASASPQGVRIGVVSDSHTGLSPGAGAGYIRRNNRGTFGYIRVHSGTFGYIRVHSGVCAAPPDLPDTHENQQIVGPTLFAQGTFAACTHPFYKTKKGEAVFVAPKRSCLLKFYKVMVWDLVATG